MATTVTGAIRFGEANGLNFKTARRSSGQSWLWLAMFLLAIMGIYGVAAWLGGIVQEQLGLPGFVTAIAILAAAGINLFVVWPAYRRLARRDAARRLHARGMPDPIPCAVTVDDQAFTYAIGEVVATVRWAAVTDLFPAGRYWVVVAQGSRYFVPRRFFPDPAAERAGVAEMLGVMSEAARARAKEAAAFVAKA